MSYLNDLMIKQKTFYKIFDTAFKNKKLQHNNILNRLINEEEWKNLGPDLSAAKFILSINGSVKFSNVGSIYSLDDYPKKFNKNYRLLEIYAQGLNIYYEELDYFTSLKYLEKIVFNKSSEFNVWHSDKLSSLFYDSKTLKYLEFINCENMNDNSLISLAKIPSLKHISLSKSKHFQKNKFSKLFIELFNIHRPDIQIEFK